MISKILETGDFKTLKDQQIKESFFTGEHRRIFHYIFEVFKKTHEVPTVRAVEEAFPHYKFDFHEIDGEEKVGTDESLLFWCEELRTKTKHNKTVDTLEEVAQLLDEGNTEEAYAKMKEGVWRIEDSVVLSEAVDITKTEDRKEAYLERKKSKGMRGIPTGLDHLDRLMKGLEKDTLTTIIGNTGVGKSWAITLLGVNAMLWGAKVCVFLTEMSTELMRDRFEAMIYGKVHGAFDYSKFKNATLTPEEEEEYFYFLEEELPILEPLIIEPVSGVSSVVSVIEQEKPDLVLIDGAYLMEDEQNAESDWLRVAHITRDLKKIAKSCHIPIVINTQADKNSSKKVGPELSDIMYTQAIGQDSDNVLALFRDEVMCNDREMGLKILKQREGTLGKILINWDFSTMNFTSIYSEDEQENDGPGDQVLGID